MLSPQRINELANRKGVNRVAVINFLSTLNANPTYLSAIQNLDADAKSYRWSFETIKAIRVGIVEYFRKSI